MRETTKNNESICQPSCATEIIRDQTYFLGRKVHYPMKLGFLVENTILFFNKKVLITVKSVKYASMFEQRQGYIF